MQFTSTARKDSEPNLILAAFREYGEAGAENWLATINGESVTYDYIDVVGDVLDAAFPEEIEHARKVLTRLAGLNKEDFA